VMKPAGIGAFIEPLSYNPAIAIYRRRAEAVRTPDERPLRFRDIRRFEPYFADVSHREFWLTSLAIFGKFFLVDRAHPSRERYWKKVITDASANAWWFRRLPELDETLLRIPGLSALCWNTVIRVAGPPLTCLRPGWVPWPTAVARPSWERRSDPPRRGDEIRLPGDVPAGLGTP
jgi:hypothetical protein